MIRLTIPVSDIATQIVSYNKIEIGRANTKADADARTGTWANIGQVITLVPNVSAYTYDDDGAADGQFHTYRLINSSTSAAGSYTTIIGRSLGYLTAEEFRSYQMGDLSDPSGNPLTDATIDSFIGIASRLVDSYVGYSFALKQTTERHNWSQKTRRVYPRQKPIVAVTDFRVYVSNQQNAHFTVADVFVNSDRGYVEVTSLATVTYSLFPAIVALGLIEPVAEIVYTHGYQYIPSDVKDAIALITVDLIAKDSLAKQGMNGLTRLRVGDMEMQGTMPAKGGVLPGAIPNAALTMLDNYRFLAVR
jgi:hypothetical protein